MRIFVAGRSGQVAQSLLAQGEASGHVLEAFGRPDFDLVDKASVDRAVDAFGPDLVINAAAYTAVDQAESEEGIAKAINGVGAGYLAAAAARHGVPILHLSTDYVFAGDLGRPYREDDATGPVGAYGRSKLAGERAVADDNPKHLILRTAWVVSPYGKNFVKTMLYLAETRDELGVVSDQVGNPTYAPHIAAALLALADQIADGKDGPWGIGHLVAEGSTSWANVAAAVFQESAALGGPSAQVNRITTADYPTPAKRPANSRLENSWLAAEWGVTLPAWQDGVRACVEALLKVPERTD